MSDFLEKMKLPNSNEQEELEQLSKDKLRPLFDLKKFQIREEVYRDKGIDLDVELKFNGKHTNFRFLIQLKATDTIEQNADGSYSKSIETSNIHYLLNSGKPSYYILYHNPTEEFYHSNINDFLKMIVNGTKDWEEQDTNTLRFNIVMDGKALEDIYNNVLERGKNMRRINEKIALSAKDNFGKMSINNENLNFYDEGELRDKLEQFGLGLINEGNSRLVINASNLISKNLCLKEPKFNLVLAIAHYNTGNMLAALSALKESGKYLGKLNNEDLSLHRYFTAAVKYSLGLLNSQEYAEIMDSIEESSFIQYYIEIDKLGRKHTDSTDNYSLKTYKLELDKFLNQTDVPNTIINLANTEYYKYWSLDLNIRNLQNSMLLSKDVYNSHVIEAGQKILKQLDEIQSFHETTINKMVEDKDYFNYWLLDTHRINYHFESFLIDTIVYGVKESNTEGVEFLLGEIRKIKHKYEQIGHIENQVVCMTHEFEMLEFLKKEDELKKLEDEITGLLELYELRDFKRRFDLMKNGSTKSRRLQDFYEESKNNYDDTVRKVKKYTDKVAALDEKDTKRQNLLPKEIYSIELFPLGISSFSKGKLQELYDILQIEEIQLINQLENMFKFVIPRINLFKPIIIEEGFLNGILEYEGVNSWKLVYERRRKLFEKEFIKTDI